MEGIVFLPGFISSLLTLGVVLPAFSQLTSDNTTNTTVTANGNNFNIINGIQKGNNLFHSFKDFSIPTGNSAIFNNSTDVVNIINRVTGRNISNIDGLIKANGNANLFLINPAGIVFGANAKLDIGGSFFGTTAQSILFKDGFEFSAVNPQTTPLLTVSVPLGLQMGQNPGDIKINNTGHQLTGSFFEAVMNQDPSIVGLQLTSGKTLALVGGNLTLNGGVLTVPDGKVELSAIGNQNSPSQVGLILRDGRWQVTYDTVEPAGNIQFLQQALVDTSGTGQGAVQIWGENLTMQDGSVVWLQNQGNQATGPINVNIAKNIDLIGAAPNTRLASGIYAEAIGTGRGSDITVYGKQITFEEGGNIQSRTFSSGNSGGVTINASSIELFDSKSDLILGVLGTRIIQGSGNSGDVTVNTQRLDINGGGTISASNFGGTGNSGNILINASESVELTGLSFNVNDTFIGASTISAVGDAGNITINTPRLSVNNGAFISSSTFGAGRSGTITVNASEVVTLNGSRSVSQDTPLEPSSIRTIGLLASESFRSFLGLPDRVTGSGGGIILNTPKLEITDGAEILVSHESLGDAGTLQINADSIFLDNQGQISADTASGNGGNINLNLQSMLLIRRGSLIDTEADGKGNGGNITINSPIIVGFENSDIIANAVEGNGGNVDITTQGIFGLEFRDQLTEESDITASSQFGVNGTVEINNLSIDPSTGLTELPVKIADASQKIAQGCSSNTGSRFVVTGRGGVLQNPNKLVRINSTWSDIRNLSAYRQQSSDVNEITTISKKQAIVEATGFIRNSKGEIELFALENKPSTTKKITECSGADT